VIKMSTFLTDVSSGLEYEGTATTITTPTGTYEYHLPHTKTIDLIGEEFAPRGGGHGKLLHHHQPGTPNVVVVSAVPISAGNVFTATSTGGCSQLIQAMPQSVSAAGLSLVATGHGLNLSNSVGVDQLLEQHQHLNLSTGTVDMPTLAAAAAGEENGGVLLCNLDELSRYDDMGMVERVEPV
jgi:hypothetical protein